MDLYTAFFRTNPQTRNAGRKLYLALGISLTPGRLPSTAPAETRFMTQKDIPPKSGLHDLLSFGFWAMKSICLMVKPQCLKSQCLILLKGEILQTRKVCRIFVESLPPWALYPSSERPRVIMRHTPHFSKPVEASTWHDRERVKFWDPKFGGKKTRLQTVRWSVSKQECL